MGNQNLNSTTSLPTMSAQFDFSKAAQKPPPTSKGLQLGGQQPPGSRGARLGTMQRANENRPITSNKSAGFGNQTKQGFNTTANKFNNLKGENEKDKQMEPEK